MKILDFYINNWCCIKNIDDIDLSSIPGSFKRRLGNVDRVCLSLLSRAYNPNIDEIVFCSIYGELDRLLAIIKQYQSFNEVSPIQFSASVHNYPIGAFCQIQKTNIPYSAVSSNENTISMGLIQAVTSQNKNVLFCYSDYYKSPMGFSAVISKQKIDENSIKCQLNNIENKIINNEFEDFIYFLTNKTDFFRSFNCEIKKIKE